MGRLPSRSILAISELQCGRRHQCIAVRPTPSVHCRATDAVSISPTKCTLPCSDADGPSSSELIRPPLFLRVLCPRRQGKKKGKKKKENHFLVFKMIVQCPGSHRGLYNTNTGKRLLDSRTLAFFHFHRRVFIKETKDENTRLQLGDDL